MERRVYNQMILREELEQVAEEILELMRLAGQEVSDELRDKIRATAHTVPRVAGDVSWWVDDAPCFGCLVGWILHGTPEEESIEAQVGYAYIRAMRKVLGQERWLNSLSCLQVVDVEDGENLVRTEG